MIMIGIYKITNLINGKNYIGQSIHIEKRWKEHCKESSNSLISQAIKKYGRENFSFSVLEEAEKSQLNDLEKKYIIIFNSIVPNGYNILTGADSDYTSFGKYDLETFKHIINDIKYSSLTLDEIAIKYSLSITRSWKVHHPSKTAQPPQDFIRINKMAVKMNATTYGTHKDFRKNIDIRKKMRHGTKD